MTWKRLSSESFPLIQLLYIGRDSYGIVTPSGFINNSKSTVKLFWDIPALGAFLISSFHVIGNVSAVGMKENQIKASLRTWVARFVRNSSVRNEIARV